MDHLLTDYAVQIRNRMQNQTGRALPQEKNNSLWKRIRLLRSFPVGSYFSKILFILLSVQRNIQFLFVLKINNSQLFFQNKPSDVHMSGILQELPVLRVRIRSYGISSQEERRP